MNHKIYYPCDMITDMLRDYPIVKDYMTELGFNVNKLNEELETKYTGDEALTSTLVNGLLDRFEERGLI